MLNGSVTNPAGRPGWLAGIEYGMLLQPTPVCGLQPGGGLLEFAAPLVLNSTPAEAVVPFEITALLMKLEAIPSCIQTPRPDQPATVLPLRSSAMLTWRSSQ